MKPAFMLGHLPGFNARRPASSNIVSVSPCCTPEAKRLWDAPGFKELAPEHQAELIEFCNSNFLDLHGYEAGRENRGSR